MCLALRAESAPQLPRLMKHVAHEHKHAMHLFAVKEKTIQHVQRFDYRDASPNSCRRACTKNVSCPLLSFSPFCFVACDLRAVVAIGDK